MIAKSLNRGLADPSRQRHGAMPSSLWTMEDALIAATISTAIVGAAASFGKIYAYHIAVAGMLFYRFTSSGSGVAQGFRSKQERFFLLSIVWFLCGLGWSWSAPETLVTTSHFLCGTLLVISIVSYVNGDWRRFQFLLKFSALVYAIDIAIGLMESTTGYHPGFSPYADGNIDKLEQMTVWAAAESKYCPTGFHWNPNNYAVVMWIILPIAALYFSPPWGSILAALLIWLIAAAGSRGALTTAVMMFFALPAFKPSYSGTALILRGGMSLAIFLAIYLAIYFTGWKESAIGEKVVSLQESVLRYINDERDAKDSIGIRQRLIENGLESLHESRGLGIGLGADKSVQRQRGFGNLDIVDMHNFWVEMAVGAGYPYIALFAIFYLSLIVRLYLLRSDPDVPYQIRVICGAFACSLVGFIAAAISASSVIYVLPHYWMYGMAIGIMDCARTAKLVKRDAQSNHERKPRQNPVRSCAPPTAAIANRPVMEILDSTVGVS